MNDPFTDSLDIRLIPLFAAGAIRQAFVDIFYEDRATSYRREERIELAGNATEPVPVRIALLDATKRGFRHRITLVGADGSLVQKAPVDSEETLIGVGGT